MLGQFHGRVIPRDAATPAGSRRSLPSLRSPPGRLRTILPVRPAPESFAPPAAATPADGHVWFVFVGHGAPSRNQQDGLLVGFDAQQVEVIARHELAYARGFANHSDPASVAREIQHAEWDSPRG